MEWIKYDGTPQHHQEAQNAEGRHGRILPWVVGRDQFSFLSTYADVLSSFCAGCGTNGSIHTQRWSCEKCNADILNPAQAGMSTEQINAIVHKPCVCNYCRHVGYPREVVACTNCQAPRRATLYDATIPMRASKNSEGKTQLMTPGNPVIGPIGQQFQDLLGDLPDLLKKFAPTSVAEQQALFANGGPEHSGGSHQQHSGPPAQAYGSGQPHMQNQPPQNYQQPQNFPPQNPHMQGQPAYQQQPAQAPQYQQPAQQQPQQPYYQQPNQAPQYQQPAQQPQYQQQPQYGQQPQYQQPQAPAVIPGGYNPNGYQGQ
jgi:hypothetical protein